MMEVDNCQNNNFCEAVCSNGSLCVSGSPECLCRRGSGEERCSDGRCRGWCLSASHSSEPRALSLAAGPAPDARRGGFPSERGADGAGCIIDNSVIYLCFLGYIKQLSLSELNIVCSGTVSPSCVGWRRPAARLVFGPAERSGDVSWGLAALLEAARDARWCQGLIAARNAEAGDSLASAVLTSGLPDALLCGAGQMCVVARVPAHLAPPHGGGCVCVYTGVEGHRAPLLAGCSADCRCTLCPWIYVKG